jgi:excisionase family DNA binding protein
MARRLREGRVTLLTIPEVAERLRVSSSQVRTYHRREGLKVVRLSPRTVRVREEDLAEWLESRVVNGAAGASIGPARATGGSVSRFPRMASDDVAKSGSTARRRPPAASSRASSAGSVVDFPQRSPA